MECSDGLKQKTNNETCPMCRSNHTEWGSIANTKKSAEKGNNSARVQLACAYRYGTKGLKKNEQKYLELLRLAADDGDVQGLFHLSCYYRGINHGTPVDVDKGDNLFRQAAELGCEMSTGELAFSSFEAVSNTGFSGPEAIEAMQYFTLFMASQKRRLAAGKLMANDKVPLAAHFVGMIYAGKYGLDPGAFGVTRNLYLAKHYYEIAAHLGREKVYYELGDTIEDIWLQQYNSEDLLYYPGACAKPK